MSDKKTSIGGIELSDIKDSEIHVGNVHQEIRAEGDIIGGNKEIHNYYYNVVSVEETIAPLPYEPETVLVAEGIFIMGTDDGEDYEGPGHELTLPAYGIGKYPVTNGEYAEFIAQNAAVAVPNSDDWSAASREPDPDRLQYPVAGVSWPEAQAFCVWLTQQTQAQRVYRLPSEAEWEKAARGLEGRIYPWGNDWIPGRCNHSGEDGEITPVKTDDQRPTYPAGLSPVGCADMAGNVQEWTQSLWGDHPAVNMGGYPFDPEAEPQYLRPRWHYAFRIHRGRAYWEDTERFYSSNRGCASSLSKVNWRGFRVVLVLPQDDETEVA